MRTVMRTAACNDDALDRSLAGKAWLAGAHVDTVLKLEESFFAVGVDVIRDGRPAGFDGFVQDFAHGFVQFAKLIARDGAGTTTRADVSTEERFVRIDVADPAEQPLI